MKLSKEQRATIIRLRRKGVAVRRIALRLECSETAVKAYLKRRKRRLWDKWLAVEDEVMALRYAYYCKAISLVSDEDYDVLEALAKEECPKSSPVYKPGSDKEEDYPPHVRALAMYLIFKYRSPKHVQKSVANR